MNHRHTRRRTLCPLSEKSLLNDIKKDETLHKIQVIHGYIHRHRLIPQHIYCKLKALRVCENCGRKIDYPPEIHHIRSKKEGGKETLENLLAVCEKCHKFLDAQNELERHKEEK